MLESGLAVLVTLATGGILTLVGQRWQHHKHIFDSDAASDTRNYVENGLYSLSVPGKAAKSQRLDAFKVQRHLLILYPQQAVNPIHISPHGIQWVSPVQTAYNGHLSIMLHLEDKRQWHLLKINLHRTDMLVLMNWLKHHLPAARISTGKLMRLPVGPVPARMIEEDLQGTIASGLDVSLYLIPNLLLVLRDNEVQAKLALSSIRRVLAVERGHRKFEQFWQRNSQEGLIRLYSLRETAAFLSTQHLELAEEIAAIARCPLEVINREDKTNKIQG